VRFSGGCLVLGKGLNFKRLSRYNLHIKARDLFESVTRMQCVTKSGADVCSVSPRTANVVIRIWKHFNLLAVLESLWRAFAGQPSYLNPAAVCSYSWTEGNQRRRNLILHQALVMCHCCFVISCCLWEGTSVPSWMEIRPACTSIRCILKTKASTPAWPTTSWDAPWPLPV
jgi:hypothetical protein